MAASALFQGDLKFDAIDHVCCVTRRGQSCHVRATVHNLVTDREVLPVTPCFGRTTEDRITNTTPNLQSSCFVLEIRLQLPYRASSSNPRVRARPQLGKAPLELIQLIRGRSLIYLHSQAQHELLLHIASIERRIRRPSDPIGPLLRGIIRRLDLHEL
jgi:hypothetical protein